MPSLLTAALVCALQVDVSQVVTQVLDTMSHMGKEGVQLVKKLTKVPDIIGDASRITQILFNLVPPLPSYSLTASVLHLRNKIE